MKTKLNPIKLNSFKIFFLVVGFEDGVPTFTYHGRLNISSVSDLKAGSEEELLESSRLEASSTLESSAVEGEISMASSGMAIDTDMEDAC